MPIKERPVIKEISKRKKVKVNDYTMCCRADFGYVIRDRKLIEIPLEKEYIEKHSSDAFYI